MLAALHMTGRRARRAAPGTWAAALLAGLISTPATHAAATALLRAAAQFGALHGCGCAAGALYARGAGFS